MRPELINASVLAYLGDSIFEVLMKLELINGDAIPKGVKMKVLIICIQQDLKQSLGLYT